MGPDSPFLIESRRRRALVTCLLVAGVVVALSSAFFRTQVIRNSDYSLRSDDHRMRVMPIPAARGDIVDRHGELIAETRSRYTLYLQPTSVDSARAGLLLMQPRLGLTDEEVERLVQRLTGYPDELLLVSRALDVDQVSWLEERRIALPEFLLEEHPQRHYPHGEAIAHLVGYVGEISADELADTLGWKDYQRGQLIGKAGLERQYESVLGGVMGERYVEVDAQGRVIGTLAPRELRPPVAGGSLQLSIDLGLQRFIHEIFPKDEDGAVVAIVPSTGEVLAVYSHPTYDPNLLIGGTDANFLAELNTDPRRPLLNRATSSTYAPGATWKIATALVGLETRTITASTRMPEACSGGMNYAGRYSRCWKQDGHGSVELTEAIATSCNVYFYQLGIWIGLNQLAREGTRLGFSRRTGIDLPAEQVGSFPSGEDWYRQRSAASPSANEVLSLAIGQGPNAQTPVRMAQFFAALAGNGRAPTPRIRSGVRGESETDLGLRSETIATLRNALGRVLEPGGTAYMSALTRWKVYGKTGASQTSQDAERSHDWFTGFAGRPGEDPEIAFAVVIELGGSGSGSAALIGARLAEQYLNGKHGE